MRKIRLLDFYRKEIGISKMRNFRIVKEMSVMAKKNNTYDNVNGYYRAFKFV